MSEPTLWQECRNHDPHGEKINDFECCEGLMYGVRVEHCEHGNVFRHYVVAHSSLDSGWCPGAWIGGDDDE